MPSTAISAQGSTVSIGTTTGSAINITTVALTNPCRVTLASVGSLTKGDVLTFASVRASPDETFRTSILLELSVLTCESKNRPVSSNDG